MNEKIKLDRLHPYRGGHYWESGYFKPTGKIEKRTIHKKIRRMKDLDTNRKGIYNRIGVVWDWS